MTDSIHELANKKCKDVSPVVRLKGKELDTLLEQLPTWMINADHEQLEKEYIFKNFKQALAFTNAVGAIAEQEQHHPNILLRWGSVFVVLWTHNMNGLTQKDFILAAKCDEAYHATPHPQDF